MSLTLHPSVLRMNASRLQLNRLKVHELVAILYHADPETLHQELPDLLPPRTRRAPLAPHAHPPPSPPPPPPPGPPPSSPPPPDTPPPEDGGSNDDGGGAAPPPGDQPGGGAGSGSHSSEGKGQDQGQPGQGGQPLPPPGPSEIPFAAIVEDDPDETPDATHDALWCKHALQFLKVLARSDKDDPNSCFADRVFSIRCNLPVAAQLETMKTIASIHQVNSSNMQSEDFEFIDEECEDQVFKPAGRIEPMAAKHIFFSFIRTNPSQMVVLDGAAHVEDTSAVAIVMQDLDEFRRDSKVIRTRLHAREDDLENRTMLMTPSTFTKSEMERMLYYDTVPQLHHHFGLPQVDEVDQHILATVTAALLPTGSARAQASCSTFVVIAASDLGGKQLICQKHLQAHGLTQCHHIDDQSSSWSLTALGVKSLLASNTLVNNKYCFQAPRARIDNNDAEVIELYIKLKLDGWSYSLLGKHARHLVAHLPLLVHFLSN